MSKQIALDFREHDLPPEWDGKPIAWDDQWSQDEPFICPPPKDNIRCDDCGSTKTAMWKLGKVGPFRAIYRSKYNEIKRTQNYRHISALRCPDCLADTIVDHELKVWVLGPEDYGKRGSYVIDVDSLNDEPAPAPELLRAVKGRRPHA